MKMSVRVPLTVSTHRSSPAFVPIPPQTHPTKRLKCNIRASHQNQQPQDRSDGASRRDALRALIATLSVASSTPARAFSTSPDVREGKIRHSDAEWREILSPDQYAVLRTAATERRFSSPLVDVRLLVHCLNSLTSEKIYFH